MKSHKALVQYTSGAKSRARNNRERSGVGKAWTTNSARITLHRMAKSDRHPPNPAISSILVESGHLSPRKYSGMCRVV